ncbi:hypothetical protein DPMN_092463 [Dreissena polymorpha]|uniref:Uncharacterized protein n=1 Tax=Dreissena polymorpha TaxID=45954 RepID=A0A9D4L1K8_DREPO|nr:hypothetical protein DPMN_092463 [Dreissena polymorpha]
MYKCLLWFWQCFFTSAYSISFQNLTKKRNNLPLYAQVECQAKGSNPAPKVEIRFEGASIAMSDIGDKSVVSGRPSYSKTVSVTTDVAALDMDQFFTCEKTIAGNHYITKVASIKVRSIIGKLTIGF